MLQNVPVLVNIEITNQNWYIGEDMNGNEHPVNFRLDGCKRKYEIYAGLKRVTF